MQTLHETIRQIRLAALLISVVIITGVIGFTVFEGVDLLNAVWMTIITLTTIGYGDIVPHSTLGRIFNLGLILFGLGVYAFAVNAIANLAFSPVIRDLRQRARARREIARMSHHFIICGSGQLVDTIIELMQLALESGQEFQRAELYALGALFAPLRRRLNSNSQRQRIRDSLVIVTDDDHKVSDLHMKALRVIKGASTDDQVLQDAGVERARAMMVTLDDDATSLLTVLTARQYNSRMLITTAILEEDMRDKITRVGANSVILPYEVGGHFLNMATLRPAVSDFFNHILLNWVDQISTSQLMLWPDSPWVGRTLAELDLRARFGMAVLAILEKDGSFRIAPTPDYRLQEKETLVAVLPFRYRDVVFREALDGQDSFYSDDPDWQRLSLGLEQLEHPHEYSDAVPTLEQVQQEVDRLSHHFIICADGRAGREAVDNLDPTRPFVIITHDEAYADLLRHLGFRIVYGSPTHESTLTRAGIQRALSIMVTLEGEADSALTVLTSRSLNRSMNITAAAYTSFMESKLRRAGADRVAMPTQVAAQFIMLATIRPTVIDFFQYVVFNRKAGIETAELYMQADSPFIGKTLHETNLRTRYNAYVIGIRCADGGFLYAPPEGYVIQANEVLIVVTPMHYADELRVAVRGHTTGPLTQLARPAPVH